jgi:hypothetical protein
MALLTPLSVNRTKDSKTKYTLFSIPKHARFFCLSVSVRTWSDADVSGSDLEVQQFYNKNYSIYLSIYAPNKVYPPKDVV